MKAVLRALLFFTLYGIGSSVSFAADTASLPRGYEKWPKSRARIITDKNSLFYGIHYIYVENNTLKTYRNGGAYPQGSRFVVENFAIRDGGGKPVEGKKSMIVMMRKDRKQQATGGWLFAGFTPEGKPAGIDPRQNCFECHQKDTGATDLVISKFADFR